MPQIFTQIHRLKCQPGWTWDHFLTEIDRLFPAGLDEKTLYAHYRQPHRKAKQHVARVINQLHERCFPNPFPQEVEQLIQLYNHLYQHREEAAQDQAIDNLAAFVAAQLQQPGETDALRRARLWWLLGNVHFDRIALFRKYRGLGNVLTQRDEAIEDYLQAMFEINRHNELLQKEGGGNPLSEFTLYKVHQNILACYLNAVEPEKRYTDRALLTYLTESDFFVRSHNVLDEEPYQWVVARNGLRFSSLTQDDTMAQQFFRRLAIASPYFLALDYEPLGYPAIVNSPEFEWVVENLLTEHYIATVKSEIKR